MNKLTKPLVAAVATTLVGLSLATTALAQDSLKDVMTKRGLTEKDVLAVHRCVYTGTLAGIWLR
jgi:hypothetical protein